MTQKQKAMVTEYNRMTSEYLHQVYKTCSAEKQRAYEACRRF